MSDIKKIDAEERDIEVAPFYSELKNRGTSRMKTQAKKLQRTTRKALLTPKRIIKKDFYDVEDIFKEDA